MLQLLDHDCCDTYGVFLRQCSEIWEMDVGTGWNHCGMVVERHLGRPVSCQIPKSFDSHCITYAFAASDALERLCRTHIGIRLRPFPASPCDTSGLGLHDTDAYVVAV